MKLQLKNTLRTSLCAAAVLSAAWAQAQTHQPMPANAAQPAMQHQQESGHKQPAKMQHHNQQQKASSSKYATPQQHERAAVQHERRQGTGPNNPQGAQLTEFQRNALQRCAIFKTNEDRSACVERVRQPKISGSIEGGGVLREYTQTVRIDPPKPVAPTVRPVSPSMADRTPEMPSNGQYQAPQPNPHPHLVHPPVKPVSPAQ